MGERRRRSSILGVLFAFGCMVALGVAPSAQAANVVPNSGFELNCAGVPCNWSVVPGTAVTLAYDTVNPNPPSTASMKVTVAQNTAIGPISDCVPVVLAQGSYSASFSYRTTATLTHVPGLTAFSYASNNCTGPSFSLGNLNAPSTISDGAWHAVSGTPRTLSRRSRCNSSRSSPAPAAKAPRPPSTSMTSSLKPRRSPSPSPHSPRGTLRRASVSTGGREQRSTCSASRSTARADPPGSGSTTR